MTIYSLARHFDAELTVRSTDDGHIVEGLVAPYGQPADVDDEHGRYREVFTPASFANWLPQLRRAHAEHRIGFNLDHSEAFDHRIGFARTVEEVADGLRFVFRLYNDPARIDKIRDMLATSHRGLSVEALAAKHRPAAMFRGAREWLGVRISGVAATPKPVHAGARVLALRAQPDDVSRHVIAAMTASARIGNINPAVPGDLASLPTPRLDAAMERWGATAPVPVEPSSTPRLDAAMARWGIAELPSRSDA